MKDKEKLEREIRLIKYTLEGFKIRVDIYTNILKAYKKELEDLNEQNR